MTCPSDRTIGELEADGYTHAEAYCAGCRWKVHLPFRLLALPPATPFSALAERLICKRCKIREGTAKPWKQPPFGGMWRPSKESPGVSQGEV